MREEADGVQSAASLRRMETENIIFPHTRFRTRHRIDLIGGSMRRAARLFANATAMVVFALLPCAYGQGQNSSRSANPGMSENPVHEAARQNPGDFAPAAAAGEFYFAHEQWRQSAYWLAKAHALAPRDRQIAYDLISACIQNGDLKKAEQQLQEMTAEADTARLHGLYGDLKERSGDHAGAAHEYYRAAEQEPSEAALFDLANFLLQHKKYAGYLAESVKFFRYGVSKFPNSAQMRVGLGVALYSSEEYDEAVRVLCEAVDLAPNDPRPAAFLGMARRVSPELAEEVDRRLAEFVERYPRSAAANYEFAVSLWDRKGGEQGANHAEIEKLLRKSIVEAPQWYEPHYQLGLLLEDEKNYADAIREYCKASSLQPAFKAAHFRLAILYRRTGDLEHAAREAKLAKQLDSEEIESTSLQGGSK